MNLTRTALVLVALMVGAAVAGSVVRPSIKASADAGPRFVLDDAVPKSFGEWHELPRSSGLIVDPQTKQLIDKIYSQTLVRTYVNDAGYHIMLSLSYGEDQRGDLALHRPEICYPAQGFTVTTNDQSMIETPYGAISGRRLTTKMGARLEPVTYWVTVGNKTVQSKWENRLIQLRMGLSGRVPDGLLFRVSSIDGDTDHAFKAQDDFVRQLLAVTSGPTRLRLSGLST